MNIKRLFISILMVGSFIISCPTLYAQTSDNIKLQELSTTYRKNHHFSMYAYGLLEIGAANNLNIIQSSNSLYFEESFFTAFNVGFSFSYIPWGFPGFGLLTDVGYERGKYSSDRKLEFRSGTTSDWLTVDVAPMIASSYWGLPMNFFVGLKSKYFLHSRSRPVTDFSFSGLPSGCFNKVSLCWFTGVEFDMQIAKFNVRLGSYIVPMINPNKLAYYKAPDNKYDIEVNGFYFEVGLRMRLFTNFRKDGSTKNIRQERKSSNKKVK